MPTVVDIIAIAKKSQFLSENYIDKAGLYGGGVDIELPKKLYCVRKNVEWLYDLDNTDTTLTKTANYLYALCGFFGLEAQSLSGTGATAAAISGQVPDPYYFVVSDSSFITNGSSSKTITSFIGFNLSFQRNNIPQTQVTTEDSYFTWNKTTGLFTCSPALVTGELIGLIPV